MGIWVLLTLIVLVTILNFCLPLFFRSSENQDLSFLIEAAAFKKSLVSMDSVEQLRRQQAYTNKYNTMGSHRYEPRPKLSPFAFDPNTADSTTLITLGLKPYAISNLLKYRRKGARFLVAEDLGKVFGISTQQLVELKPFVQIKVAPVAKVDTVVHPKRQAKTEVVVELNSADTTLLMQVKGIGRGYAKGIVALRSKLGGFVGVEQLKEVYGMRAENFERIVPFCKVDASFVKKMNVNSASVARLESHPYLNFYQAKAIYELRRNKGRLNDLNSLKVLSELSPDDVLKLKPYLNFE